MTAVTPRGLAIAAAAFARARWRQQTLRTRAAVARYHARQLRRLEQHLRHAIPFYRALPRADWPVGDKQLLLDHFAAMNVAGITLDEARAAAAGEQRRDGFVVGHSTGTSGNRGYFVIGDAERYVWLGTLLAKALPDALWRRHRVAIVLPGVSELYRAAGGGSRVALRFFDATAAVDRWLADYAAFAPDTIVAAPKVLRLLAERGVLATAHTFSAAETLDPLDRAVIERATGHPLREIYMATEGLFGVSCAHGTLHLAEDVVHFEYEAAGDGLVTPLVTDFTRRAQAMVRYRMNDLLALDPAPCRCGSAFQPVRAVVGRSDDVFELADAAGALHPVLPAGLRNAVVAADPAIDDFRIEQTGPAAITVRLPPHVPAAAEAAVRAALAAVAVRHGAAVPAVTIARGIDVPLDRKLRRVERRWRG